MDENKYDAYADVNRINTFTPSEIHASFSFMQEFYDCIYIFLKYALTKIRTKSKCKTKDVEISLQHSDSIYRFTLDV